MWRWLKNIMYLTGKEFKSLFSDSVLLILIIYIFTFGIWTSVSATSTELKNAAVAVVDNDRSALSKQLIDSLLAPQFKPPVEITAVEVDRSMDMGKYSFVLDIPPNYQADLLAGYNPKIQLLVDATAMTQAAIGSGYIQRIFATEIQKFFRQDTQTSGIITPTLEVLYNPNHTSRWFMSVMQVVGNISLITLLLSGAAVIRERERGTIEHLLVMPVSSSEIALSKIIANGAIILTAAILSLYFVVHIGLDVPIPLRVFPLFSLGVVVFLFSMASLGILLATIAPTMPQFGLLCIPVYVVMHMLSGITSPVENMPVLIQNITLFSPQTILSTFAQQVLFKQAPLSMVHIHLIKMLGMGTLFLIIALVQFKTMLSRQG
ncbi:ABC transporter permease [Pelistega europaea]|uniref:ABC transporter permease n=1 Tax=Pelistega europaea TaxID=106147 RepID=A0A7Y4P4S9_9BURK|nr:ABC transporter permease [Pelistega europaea]NOL49816.1 ABC transporter permease [Pelistega europaea]